ncbi:MAG: aldehyde dehydrogenase family protein [Armatimonadota bacterium]
MTRDFEQYIGGTWTPGASRNHRSILSPYDGREVGSVAVSELPDAETALAQAHAAFAETQRLPSHVRHDILRQIEDGISARREELALGISDEAGKPIRDARIEVDRARLVFSLAADEARRFQNGDFLPLDLNPASNGRIGISRRFPLGLVAALTPFNFPLNLVAHKVAPALAAGCPLVLKPAEKTPLTALRLAEIVAETDWPKGAFSVLTPSTPQEIGSLLATDSRIKVVSFTGSAQVGWELKAKANRKKVTLELGGNAAVIVHDDVPDLDYAISRCVSGAFANAGQVCISVQRIFVHQALFDDFLVRFADAVSRMVIGDPGDTATDIGPMISDAACHKAEAWRDEALSGGARAVLLGSRRSGSTLLGPTILTNTAAEMAVNQEEVFAPIVVVEPYDTFPEALARVNDSRYGLQAGVFTRDVNRLFEAFATLDVGGVIANDVPQYRVDNMPYGGVKDSGFGREGVRYAIEEMTELRLLALNLSAG